ncbi:acyl-CoA dehydrogenase family protein [Actinomadura algeriensis]|uniref:Alkylation response protein AidB-like acyl-CoA dehydrogenase n=1 Tax=Actinomadura algeriensis TaxID=1679523 RepID=A0ABR9JZD0_9ACTN|nr:acyl-CoA dehydrogenase family protein [Actinomadura algeriensis]MBE1535743.1 alkylation response protein AidB-like acyl-CoA dehydrogenase [Actinomadura algeriensis]
MRRTVFETDHELFRESVREFVERTLLPLDEDIRNERMLRREVWLEAGRQGFLGMQVPAEYGGQDAGDFRFNAVIGEELARVAVAYNSIVSIHVDICAPYLLELATDEAKKKWLPGFCSGETITAIGMTEPSGGSDLAALKTTAVRDGDSWVINGSKTFITNGGHADLVIVAAKTDPERGAKGITLFGVEAGTPGFHRGTKLDKVGQPEADTSELFFENVRVPDSHVIGELNRGFVHMMERLSQERLSCAIGNVAHARGVLEETIEYVKERKAFGQAIGAFQHNKFLVAELITKLDVAQAFVDQCLAAHVAGELGAVDASKAKYWSSDVQNQIIDGCVQLFGGYGYMREYRVARAWMDARVTRIWAGSNEIMKEIIGRDAVL